MHLHHGNGRRLTYLFTLLVTTVLVLAACGGADPTPTTEAVDAEPEATETEAAEPTEMVEPTATSAPAETPQSEETEPAEDTVTPAVTVEDQMLEDGAVTVPEAVSDGPGWMVIHADDGGAPGAVIGYTALTPGQNSDVAIEIDAAAATETLYAMLHVDAGTEGTYEFPGDDAPATVDGEVVVQPFQISGLNSQAMAPQVGLELVAEGLNAPVALIPAPDDSERNFIVDQAGLIYVLNAEGGLLDAPFLDLQDRMVPLMEDFDERGLLGLAFHPNYAENGRFFVYYSAPLRESAPQDWNHTSHISEFQVSDGDPNVANPDSERILLQVDEPQFNHDGGQITFGSDGYLYIPLGDGGGANDTDLGHVEDWYEANAGGNGQDLTSNLLGSILRIDVDNEGANGEPYAIPEDNPFVDREGVPGEIWAYGFRNPFRIAFDMGGENELFVGDAGQDRWEEVSVVTAGGNYGWNVKEGTHCFDAANPGQALDECPDEAANGDPLIDPIIEYQNGNQEGGIGLVVIGGYVYRGSDLANFEGQYLFGDWSTSFSEGHGNLFVASRPETEGELWAMQEITIANRENGQLDEFLLSIGQDTSGELYILTDETPGPTGETGEVYRLVPASEAEMRGETAGETTAGEETMEIPEEAVATTEIAMENITFMPQVAAVEVGDTVTWTNNDGTPHTVTAGTRDNPTDLFSSGNIAGGESFAFTFEEAGAYEYFCALHPGMAGTVVVQ